MLWNRATLKSNAQIPLTHTYWTAFLVTLVYSILSNFGGKVTHIYDYAQVVDHFDSFSSLIQFMYSIMSVGLTMFGFLIGIAFVAFVTNILSVGTDNYFLQNRNQPADFSVIFRGFKTDYMHKVIVMFMKNLFVWLWSLLFIIPGIVANYSYFAVSYLLNEYPNLTWQHILDLSKRITYGRKLDIFVLDLSFYGWFILGALLCGIGIPFVMPYYHSTLAEAYIFLKEEAIATGKISQNELESFNL